MAVGTAPRDLSPPAFARALPMACDASNARAVAAREYHCPVWVSWPAGCRPRLLAWLSRSPLPGVFAHLPDGSAQAECIYPALFTFQAALACISQ